MTGPSKTTSHRDRTLRRTLWTLVACALLLTGITACSSSDSGSSDSGAKGDTSTTTSKSVEAKPVKSSSDAPVANAITVTTPGMSYEVSGDLRPGVGAITLKNTDDMSHMMSVSRLKDGVTMDQVKEAFQSQDESAFDALLADSEDEAAYGTPAYVGPGQESTVVASDLKEGNYAIYCFMATDDGTPHFALGMVGEFKVTGSPATEKPDSDGTITVDDKAFTMPEGFNGKGTFAVENTGTKPHNLQLMSLDEDTTLDSYFGGVGEAFANNKSVDDVKGGTLMGGVDGLLPGQTAWLVLDLPAGHYGYVSSQDAQATPTPPTQIGEFTVS